MKKPDLLQTREAWLLCFLLGVVMLNYPFLHIFNKPIMVLGFPLLFLYFLVGWPFSILVIFLFVRQIERDEARPEDKHEENP